MHYRLDLHGTIPSFIVVTDGRQHDVKVAKQADLPLSPDSILVFDQAYIDYQWLYELHPKGCSSSPGPRRTVIAWLSDSMGQPTARWYCRTRSSC